MAKNKYEVVKDAGVGFEVGKIIETDNLHPSLLQHVRQVSVGANSSESKPEAKPEKAPSKGSGKAKPEDKKEEAAPPPPPQSPPDDNT